jgi:hypothetical protein
MSLEKLQEQWLEKWDEMQTIEWPHITLAAPFLSVGAVPIDSSDKRIIMMVGKATHKKWDVERFEHYRRKTRPERIEERRDETTDFLQDHAPTHRSSFWALFRGLQRATGAGVIWTNLAKIGVCRPPDENDSINPFKGFLNSQKYLAQETLKAEVLEYKPDLVILVTGNYALAEIVDPVFCPDGRWKKETEKGSSFDVVEGDKGRPPVLRTGHPGFKSKVERSAWIRAAKNLLV